MATDSDNVRVLSAGTLYFAASGTTCPTDALTALNVAFKDVGLLGEDGITMSPNVTFNPIKDIEGNTVRIVRTEHSVEYGVKLIETNLNNINLLFDSDGTATSYVISDEVMPEFAFVFEVYDGDLVERHVIESGKVKSIDTITLQNSTERGYAITIEALPDADGDKVAVYMDIDGVS